MQRPEEDTGLAGKVALVSGGGAAGDGIGHGRAAAILLVRVARSLTTQGRTNRWPACRISRPIRSPPNTATC